MYKEINYINLSDKSCMITTAVEQQISVTTICYGNDDSKGLRSSNGSY